MIKKIIQKQIIPISLLALFGCTAINWLATEIVASLVVFAQTAEINLPIARQQKETYEDFLRRAEATAAKTIQERFKHNSTIEELRLSIFGENQGAIAPVLSLKVSRNGWRKTPEIQRWASYYPDSKFLLGFEQPIAPPQPQPTQSQSPQQPTPEGQKPTQPLAPTQQPFRLLEPPSSEEQPSQPESPLRQLNPPGQSQFNER
jgi:hypothetical protein